MQNVQVKLCAGTACYVLGGSELTRLSDYLPPQWRSKVSIEGILCLDLCKDSQAGRPPFVLVDDQVISQATLDKVLAAIKEKLE